MLDFRPKGGRTKNYLARREQWRLLLLVLAAGLVMLLVEEVVNPGRWAGLWKIAAQAPARRNNANDARRAKVEQPANLRRKAAEGEFIAEVEANDEIPANKRFFPGVQPELLARVRDDTVFRGSESDAFYHLLKILDEASEEQLQKASIGQVSFNQLFTQPKEFRGDLVTVSGKVHRVIDKKPPDNSFDIERYSQVVIEPDDRDYPVVIYCLDLPDGFPRGEKLHEPVTVTGFFYKRWAGLGGEKEIMTWPLILSKTVRWQPVVAANPAAEERAAANNLVSGLVLAGLASLAVVWFVVRGTRRKPTFVMPSVRAGELNQLRHVELTPDVRQQLAELARQEEP